jgi:hypothetical protein
MKLLTEVDRNREQKCEHPVAVCWHGQWCVLTIFVGESFVVAAAPLCRLILSPRRNILNGKSLCLAWICRRANSNKIRRFIYSTGRGLALCRHSRLCSDYIPLCLSLSLCLSVPLPPPPPSSLIFSLEVAHIPPSMLQQIKEQNNVSLSKLLIGKMSPSLTSGPSFVRSTS